MQGTALTIGRVHYDGGGDWYADPSSLPNLLRAVRERSGWDRKLVPSQRAR